MPLIEITNAHLLRAPLPYYYHVKHLNWNIFSKRNFNVPRPRLPFLIKAVTATIVQPKSNDTEIAATIVEPKSNDTEIAAHNHQPEQPVDEKEKLRRSKISKANKGRSAWNKGIKHRPETLQKIKERTRIAMKNPKVKIKLINHPHAQNTETRLKIAAGIRQAWEKKRVMKMVQETCCSEWQNLIAEASRQGFIGQEELQWNSYETLDDQLKQEWLVIVEQRKLMPREPSSRRAPKSPEQRKKLQ
ncbi:unnamed protein product [Lathyrus sativus]|nr:unnamed protein product [Lathyrus sativus]